MRASPLTSCIAGVVLSACGQPTEQESLERMSGPYELVKVADTPLPFIDTWGGTRLEVLAGTLTLTPQYATPSNHICSLSITFRETAGADVTQGTEAVGCTYGTFGFHSFVLTLEEGAERTDLFARAPSMSRSAVGELFNREITLPGRGGEDWVFRK